MLRIGHGNGHNRPELVDMVARSGAASFGCDESQRLALRTIRGTRVTAAGPAVADSRSRSTCIVTGNEHPNLGELSIRAARAMPEVNDKLYPDRFLIGVRYAHPVANQIGAAGVAHFEAHPPPTVMRHGENHPVVRSYADYLETLAWQIDAAESDGFLIVVTGDLQANARYSEPWGPRAVIARPFKLSCRVIGIDWIMVDRRLQFAGQLRRRELFDHTAFVATLRPKGAISGK